MSISSRFAVGIHILALIDLNKEGVTSSEFIASSVNTNPAVIRKLMGMLKRAGMIEVQPGIAGAKLSKGLAEITLFDVYQAMNVMQENELFNVHENSHADCLVGKNIQDTIEPIFAAAQLAMEKVLKNVTLEEVVKDISAKDEKSKENLS